MDLQEIREASDRHDARRGDSILMSGHAAAVDAAHMLSAVPGLLREIELFAHDRDLARGAIKASRDMLLSPEGETLYDATGRVSADLGRAREEIEQLRAEVERLKGFAVKGWKIAEEAAEDEGYSGNDARSALAALESGGPLPEIFQ